MPISTLTSTGIRKIILKIPNDDVKKFAGKSANDLLFKKMLSMFDDIEMVGVNIASGKKYTKYTFIYYNKFTTC